MSSQKERAERCKYNANTAPKLHCVWGLREYAATTHGSVSRLSSSSAIASQEFLNVEHFDGGERANWTDLVLSSIGSLALRKVAKTVFMTFGRNHR